LGSAVIKAKVIVCIPDDGNELPFHREVFHLTDERLDAGLSSAGDSTEPRS
jgi:hypothetical protein